MRAVVIIFSIFVLSITYTHLANHPNFDSKASFTTNSFSLRDNLIKGKVGNYIVTEQGNIYTLMLIRQVDDSFLILEEISVPEANIDLTHTSWKEWIESKAPGNTSWVGYKIDLKTYKLIEGFSYSRHSFLYIEDPNHFLTKLLSLTLKPTPEDKRRRIGPPPVEGEADHRAFWSPPVVIEGKLIKKPSLTAWIGRWPSDGTLLANCEVELYFGASPFPYWVDIKSPHYRASVHTIDSGGSLSSPMPPMPEKIIETDISFEQKFHCEVKPPSPSP